MRGGPLTLLHTEGQSRPLRHLPSGAPEENMGFMPGRTFAIGDIHGDLDALVQAPRRAPAARPRATRSSSSATTSTAARESKEVVEYVRAAPERDARRRSSRCAATTRTPGCASSTGAGPSSPCPRGNGCLATLRSFTGGELPEEGEGAKDEEVSSLSNGELLPAPTSWRGCASCRSGTRTSTRSTSTPACRAGQSGFLHPSRGASAGGAPLVPRRGLLPALPRQARRLRPHGDRAPAARALDATRPRIRPTSGPARARVGLDTGCGKGGFLTALELPAMRVYESR